MKGLFILSLVAVALMVAVIWMQYFMIRDYSVTIIQQNEVILELQDFIENKLKIEIRVRPID